MFFDKSQNSPKLESSNRLKLGLDGEAICPWVRASWCCHGVVSGPGLHLVWITRGWFRPRCWSLRPRVQRWQSLASDWWHRRPWSIEDIWFNFSGVSSSPWQGHSNCCLRKITYDLTLAIDLIHLLNLWSRSLIGFPDSKDFGPYLSKVNKKLRIFRVFHFTKMGIEYLKAKQLL